MENEESKGNSKLLVGVLLILVVLSLALGGYIVYDAFIAKDEVKETDDKKENDDKKPAEQTPYEKFILDEKNKREAKVILKSENGEDPFEIRITANGEVYADVKASMEGQKDITNQLLEDQVVKCFIVEVGQRDVGDSRKLILLKEDGSITAVALDSLLILNKVEVTKNVGSLKNVVDVYYNVTTPPTEFEPPGYSAYAKDIDGKETDITSILDN